MLIKHLLIILVMLPCASFATEPLAIQGIWKEVEDIKNNFSSIPRKNAFYTIHKESNIVVLLDLTRLEFNHDTLSSSYIGTYDELVLEIIQNTPQTILDTLFMGGERYDLPIKIVFLSDSKAIIFKGYGCGNCTPKTIAIEKIF